MDLEQVNSKHGEFTRLLLKTPLEKYTSQLWEAFQATACDALDFKNILTEIEDKARSRKDAATKLAKQLLAILNNEPVKAGKVTITSEKALEAIKQALIEEYKASGMNLREMTIVEAEADLKDWRNNKDTEEWIREQLDFLADELGLTYEERHITSVDLDDFCTEFSNVEFYAESNIICEEVTPEQVEKAIRLNSISKKAGRKVQNTKLHWLILEIRKYYKGNSNKDYRLIFDCMDLFGLIDEAMKKDWGNKYDPQKLNIVKASYIKSLYWQAVKYESADTQQILVERFKGIRHEFHDTL